jgi:hypothetical protein
MQTKDGMGRVVEIKAVDPEDCACADLLAVVGCSCDPDETCLRCRAAAELRVLVPDVEFYWEQ